MRISAWSSDVCSSDLDSYVAREPNYRVLGPTRDRVGSAGLVIRHGYIAAQWGDLERSAMIFSAVKSSLSTLAGLALADARINSVHEPVSRSVQHATLSLAQHAHITLNPLSQPTSNWWAKLGTSSE